MLGINTKLQGIVARDSDCMFGMCVKFGFMWGISGSKEWVGGGSGSVGVPLFMGRDTGTTRISSQ